MEYHHKYWNLRHIRFIGFKNWSTPFADEYLGVQGALGRFLGFWAVLMQAAFSFFGSEVPGIVRAVTMIRMTIMLISQRAGSWGGYRCYTGNIASYVARNRCLNSITAECTPCVAASLDQDV